MTKLPSTVVRCFGGMYPLPDDSGWQFNVVRSPAEWFVWDGRTIPDKFKGADGHVYQAEWDDEWVTLNLVEITTRLLLLPRPILAPNTYVLTPPENDFYVVRNRIREVGKNASRTDFENLIREKDPNLSIGQEHTSVILRR